MAGTETSKTITVTGGVDTHRDFHVAAVVDDHNRVLAPASFPATRQGYGRMLVWMQPHGDLRRVGVECAGSYGADLLRHLQRAGVEVREVTTPDKPGRRLKDKDDDLDTQNAAHAAFAGIRTVTPRSRDGMVEALRVLKVCRKSAVDARRTALHTIHGTIVSAPDALRDRLRDITRMQLLRTLAASRPDMSAYRDVGRGGAVGRGVGTGRHRFEAMPNQFTHYRWRKERTMSAIGPRTMASAR